LYAMWRFLKIDPATAFYGRPVQPFHDLRVDALLTAFARHAAEAESAARDAIESAAAHSVEAATARGATIEPIASAAWRSDG